MIKHVVLIGPAYPYRGGIADTNERLAIEIKSSGIKTTIYTFKLQYPSILFPGKTQFVDKSKKKPDLLILRKINSVNPLNWIKIGKELKRIKPDIIIVRYWIPFLSPALGTILRIAKKNKYTKIIAIVDNFIPHEKRLGDTLLSKYFMKSVDGCIVMSLSVKAEIERFFKNKLIEYCPHPLFDHYGKIIPKEEARKSLKLDVTKKYILFFGLVRDYKGLDLLIEAVALIDTSILNFDIIVAGEFYSAKEKYLQLIEKYHLKDRFHIYDQFIPDELIPYFFCAADVVVQPYKDATQSGVTQVAYHFNKPMIVTNVGGLSEIVPNNKVGFVVYPNPEAIAHAIIKFYTENKEELFTENAKIEKNKYSWKRMEETIYILHSKLVFKNVTHEG